MEFGNPLVQMFKDSFLVTKPCFKQNFIQKSKILLSEIWLKECMEATLSLCL